MRRFKVFILSLILVGIAGLLSRLHPGNEGDTGAAWNGINSRSEGPVETRLSGDLSGSEISPGHGHVTSTVSVPTKAVASDEPQTIDSPKRRPDERSDDFAYRVAGSVLSLARGGRAGEIVRYLDGLSPGQEGSRAVYNAARYLGSSRWDATAAEKTRVLNEVFQWYFESSLDTPEDVVYNIDAIVGDISEEDKQLALNLILGLEGRMEPLEYASAMYDVLESYEAVDAGNAFMEQVRRSLSPESLSEFSELLHRKRGK